MINVGLIGYGRYGKKYLENIKKNKNFKIIKILKDKNKKSKLFTNNKKEFFKIKKINLYIIASPINTHFEYLNIIMKKNKHIIVEKPLVKTHEEFIKFKNNLKKYRKIILINHTDLNFKTLQKLKGKIKKIGNIRSIKLVYGKKDPYLTKNINTPNDLPFYDWLSHPLSIIYYIFKNKRFKLNVKSKQTQKGKFLIQNLEIILVNKKTSIKIYFSNNYKNKKRNLNINGSKGYLIFNGYSKKKAYFIKKNKKIDLTVENDNPIQNLLKNFENKFIKNSTMDDKEIICQTTNQLLNITNQIK